MENPPGEKAVSQEPARPHPAWALTIPVLVFLLYANSLGNGFHFDDFHSLVDNPAIKSLDQIPRYFQDPTAFSTKTGNWPYRPLLLVTNALNYAAARFSLPAWHLVNLALHSLNAFLVFLVAASVFRLRAGAVAAGILFALHPLNSQAVNYFSARATLLATALVLAAFLAQAQARRRRGQGQSFGGWIILSSFLFLAGMLAKEEAALFPVLALFLEALDPEGTTLGRPRPRQILSLLPSLVILAGFLGLRAYFQGALFTPGSAEMTPIHSRAEIALTEFISPWIYLHRFLLPTSLSVFPDVVPPASLFSILPAAAGYGGLGWILWKTRGRPALALGTLWFLAGLLPAMLLSLNVLIAEHHAYLPLAGLAIALGQLIELLLDSPRPRTAAAARSSLAVAFACFGLLTFLRNPVWKDEITLWRDAVRQGPGQSVPHSLLGAAYAKDKRFEPARRQLEFAVRLRPDFADSHNTLALCYLRMGKPDQAEAEIREALRLHPDNLTYLSNLGILLMTGRRWNEAAAVFDRILQLDPGNSRSRDYRDQVLKKLETPNPFPDLPDLRK